MNQQMPYPGNSGQQMPPSSYQDPYAAQQPYPYQDPYAPTQPYPYQDPNAYQQQVPYQDQYGYQQQTYQQQPYQNQNYQSPNPYPQQAEYQGQNPYSQEVAYASQQPQIQAQPQSAQKGKSGIAVASFVLGIIAAATSFMPIINNASFFIGLVGLVLGIFGIGHARNSAKSGTGLAVAAIVLSIVACIAVIASQAFYLSAWNSVMDAAGLSSSSSATTQRSSSAQSSAQSAPSESEYVVTIDDATLTTDYDDDPALLVTFTWTNNSDDTESFAFALNTKCFQNGIQCQTTYVSDIDDNLMTEVKPGATLTVQRAFKVSGTSDVTVEVRDLFYLSETILAEKTFSLA